MKSMWSGTITFGMVSVPVKMYKGTDERSLGLHLICTCHREQITKRDRCAVDEHILTQTEKSHAIMGPQGWVEITDADMMDLPLRTMHTIEIDSFVPQVPLATHANGMYYLEPNDPAKLGSAKPYALLRDVLSTSGYYAIGRLGMRDKEQLCSLSVQGNAIVVTTLTWPELVRDTKELRLPTDVPSPEEVKLATTLVNAMYQRFWDGSAYQDAYRPALERLIASKAAGQSVPGKKEAAPVTTNDLMSQLKASVAAQSSKVVSKKKRAS